MSRKIPSGTKDENGIYTPKPKASAVDADNVDISIDDLLKVSLQIIKKAMKAVSDDVNTGNPSRESIMNLKDLMSILKDLKKEEKEFLSSLSDEELAHLGNNIK